MKRYKDFLKENGIKIHPQAKTALEIITESVDSFLVSIEDYYDLSRFYMQKAIYCSCAADDMRERFPEDATRYDGKSDKALKMMQEYGKLAGLIRDDCIGIGIATVESD